MEGFELVYEEEFQHAVLKSDFSPVMTSFLDKRLAILPINVILKNGKHIKDEMYRYILNYIIINRFNELLKYLSGGTTKVYKNLKRLLETDFIDLWLGRDRKLMEKYRHLYNVIYYLISVIGVSPYIVKYIGGEGDIIFETLLEKMSPKSLRKLITSIKNQVFIPERLMAQNKYKDIKLEECSYKFLLDNYNVLSRHYKNFDEKFNNVFSVPVENFKDYQIVVHIVENEIKSVIKAIVKNLEKNGCKIKYLFEEDFSEIKNSENKKIIFLTNKKLKNINNFFYIFVGDYFSQNPEYEKNKNYPIFDSFVYWEISKEKITYSMELLDLNIIFLQGFSTTILKRPLAGPFSSQNSPIRMQKINSRISERIR